MFCILVLDTFGFALLLPLTVFTIDLYDFLIKISKLKQRERTFGGNCITFE